MLSAGSFSSPYEHLSQPETKRMVEHYTAYLSDNTRLIANPGLKVSVLTMPFPRVSLGLGLSVYSTREPALTLAKLALKANCVQGGFWQLTSFLASSLRKAGLRLKIFSVWP